MTTKLLHEAATLTYDKTAGKFRVCLIEEGPGDSADYPGEFFFPENGSRLAEALSFAGHPMDYEHPEQRNPLSAIGYIGGTVDLEEHDGKMGFWADYNVAKSRPDVATFLEEFHSKVGLSIFSQGETREEGGRLIAESFSVNDPYRSVDIVVAPGARGKFDRQLAESFSRIAEASTPVEEKEVNMDKVEEALAAQTAAATKTNQLIESLVATVEKLAPVAPAAPVEPTAEQVEETVQARLTKFDEAVALISGADLTPSQAAELRELAKKGDDVAPLVESAKRVKDEVRKQLAESASITGVEGYLGAGAPAEFDPSVAGFGKVG